MEPKANITTDNRCEPRTSIDLNVSVKGADARGSNFAQDAVATNISMRGALLLGIQSRLRSGDLIRIEYGQQSALFRVVWMSPTEARSMKVAVQRMENQPCIWGIPEVQFAADSKNALAAGQS